MFPEDSEIMPSSSKMRIPDLFRGDHLMAPPLLGHRTRQWRTLGGDVGKNLPERLMCA